MLSDKISNGHNFFLICSAHMTSKKSSPSFINSLFIEIKYSYEEHIDTRKNKSAERIEIYMLCQAPSNNMSNTRLGDSLSCAKAMQ